MRSSSLVTFNEVPPAEAERILMSCAAIPRWAVAVVARRPFDRVEDVLDCARTAADPWTDAELDLALAGHPRIGEQAADPGPEADRAAQEQAKVGGADQAVLLRLAERNRAYEDRFGHVFLIRAAGRTAEEILGALEDRMANDPATERGVLAGQLREIALLRIRSQLP